MTTRCRTCRRERAHTRTCPQRDLTDWLDGELLPVDEIARRLNAEGDQ